MGLSKLIFVAFIGLIGWMLYKKFVGDAQKLARASEARRKEQATGAIGTLIKDPQTGEYRLRKEDDR